MAIHPLPVLFHFLSSTHTEPALTWHPIPILPRNHTVGSRARFLDLPYLFYPEYVTSCLPRWSRVAQVCRNAFFSQNIKGNFHTNPMPQCYPNWLCALFAKCSLISKYTLSQDFFQEYASFYNPNSKLGKLVCFQSSAICVRGKNQSNSSYYSIILVLGNF